MKTNRRRFLKTAGLSASALGVVSSPFAAENRGKVAALQANESAMRLGLVTYQLAQDWDLETIIKNCEAAKFDGVELRTTHAHKVEVNLSKEQREAVRKRFQNSAVQLMGLGSAFDFHTPDQEQLKQDIAAAREYIVLAHDVGATGVKVRPNALPPGVPEEKKIGRASCRERV